MRNDNVTSQRRRQDVMRGRTKLGVKLFVAHEITRSNTLNKVHVAATELPQLLSQNTDMFGEATAQSR